jgi:hypothetical protein
MAAELLAMEALASAVWRMADEHRYDVRIEAAVAKIFCSETTIRFLKDAQTIFGGMGYETADSKRARGEPAFGIEQLVRDVEMYRIGEGATDILRPFVAREALNMHLERTKNYFDESLAGFGRLVEVGRLIAFYLPWYLRQWLPRRLPSDPWFQHPSVRSHLRVVERASRRLARGVWHALLLQGQAFQEDQGRQNRIEAVGEDLLVIAVTSLYAAQRQRAGTEPGLGDLVEEVIHNASERATLRLREMLYNRDARRAMIGAQALRGVYAFLSKGVIERGLEDYRPAIESRERGAKAEEHAAV